MPKILKLEEFVGKNFTLRVIRTMRINSNNEFLIIKQGKVLSFFPTQPPHQKKFTHVAKIDKFNLFIDVEDKDKKDIKRLSRSCQLING